MGLHFLVSASTMSMSHNINAQFIHQNFVHASHHSILQMSKLGIYSLLPNYIPQLYHPCCACIIAKGLQLSSHPNVSTETLDPRTSFHLDFIFFNKIYCQNITSDPTIVDASTSHLFGYPTRSKRPPLQLIKTFIQLYSYHGYKSSIFRFDECGKLSISAYFMQIFIYHEVIVKTTVGYASSINGNV